MFLYLQHSTVTGQHQILSRRLNFDINKGMSQDWLLQVTDFFLDQLMG